MQRFLRALSLVVVVQLMSGLGPGRAAAQQAETPAAEDLERARTLFEQGIAFVDAGRWLEALAAFRASQAIVERPGTLFNIGNALFRLGRPLEAKRVLELYLRRPEVVGDAPATRDGAALLGLATRSVATLSLEISPPDAIVAVDDVPQDAMGASRSIAVEPGSHVLRVTAQGFVETRISVDLMPGATHSERVTLAPAAPAQTLQRGTLQLDVTPLDAEVRIDDVLHEGAGALRTYSLSVGEHIVRVGAEGFVAVRQSVDIAADRPTDVAVVLSAQDLGPVEEPTPVWKSPWLWTGVGVGAAGAVFLVCYLALPKDEGTRRVTDENGWYAVALH